MFMQYQNKKKCFSTLELMWILLWFSIGVKEETKLTPEVVKWCCPEWFFVDGSYFWMKKINKSIEGNFIYYYGYYVANWCPFQTL
jgi:hypothetical protein